MMNRRYHCRWRPWSEGGHIEHKGERRGRQKDPKDPSQQWHFLLSSDRPFAFDATAVSTTEKLDHVSNSMIP